MAGNYEPAQGDDSFERMKEGKPKPILCIDFDGVLHSYKSGWQGARNIPDPPVDGAMDFLRKALNEFEVCIYSSRSRYCFGRYAMKKWLLNAMWNYMAEIEPDLVMTPDPFDDQQDCAMALAKNYVSMMKFPLKKPAAFITLDDRAITFTGQFPQMSELLNFKPWNKKEV